MVLILLYADIIPSFYKEHNKVHKISKKVKLP